VVSNGIGVLVQNQAQVAIDRSILVGNGLAVDCFVVSDLPTLACSDVYGNTQGDWVGCLAGGEGVDGNFTAAPLFCDPENGDYSLDAVSPCLSVPGCGQIGGFGQGCDGVTGVVDSGPTIPSQPFLSGSVPNPFNATTTIRFGVPEVGGVTLTIFDVSGRRVITLVHGRREAGEFTMGWDGRDESGREVVSGIYFARLQAGEFTATTKMVLLR
jgi:hypothetical protein